ncbi:MAG: hypothetical protein GC158_01650 [Cyanobacteria bacterium RI_101]|nr:hypothetical protein [Cyanobacteria bacterium RI_101]
MKPPLLGSLVLSLALTAPMGSHAFAVSLDLTILGVQGQSEPSLTERLANPTLWAFGLGFIGAATGLISVIFLEKQDRQLKQLTKNYRESQQEIKTLTQKLEGLKEEQAQSYHKFKSNYQKLQVWIERLPELSKEVQQQRERILLLEQGKPTIPPFFPADTPSYVPTENLAKSPEVLPKTSASSEIDPTPISELKEIISQFNQKSIPYFHSAIFFPLKPTQASVEGSQSSLDGRSQVEFETLADVGQASYLGFSADGAAWLIPNITLPNVGRVINQLEDNPGIFALSPAGAERRLIAPAKLQSFGAGLWKIEEPGEFG